MSSARRYRSSVRSARLPRDQSLEGREELGGHLTERDLRRRSNLASTQLSEERVSLGRCLGARRARSVFIRQAPLVGITRPRNDALPHLRRGARRGCLRSVRDDAYYARSASGLTSWCRAPGGYSRAGALLSGRVMVGPRGSPRNCPFAPSGQARHGEAEASVLGAVERDLAALDEAADRVSVSATWEAAPGTPSQRSSAALRSAAIRTAMRSTWSSERWTSIGRRRSSIRRCGTRRITSRSASHSQSGLYSVQS